MEVWRVLVALFTLLSTSLTANQFELNGTGNNSFFSAYSWLAGVLGTSSNLKCILDRPLLVAPALLKAELGNFTTSEEANQHFMTRSSCCGCDLEQWDPPDWKPRPSILSVINDPQLKIWAYQIHQTWKNLGRQMSQSVLAHPEEWSSLLPLPHPFMVPSLEARELHYWDSYWLMLGMLLGDMHATAGLHIINLASLVDTYGFVPSGGRVYLATHSEPPVLAQMVELYYQHTSDLSLVKEVLPSLLTEYNFWMEKRSVHLQLGTLNVFKTEVAGPRLEAYKEDEEIVTHLPQEQRLRYYYEVAASLESGWALSSRWADGQHDKRMLWKTSKILPVDLNALLAQNEWTIYKLYALLGDIEMAEQFLTAHQARCRVFNDVFWSKERELWLDVDLESGLHRDGFYASSLVPLLWGCRQDSNKHLAVLRSIKRLGLLDYPGGIPATLTKGSEWDFPYVIAPMQWFPVLAWHDADNWMLRMAARAITQRWMAATYVTWRNTRVLLDKHPCTTPGSEVVNKSSYNQTVHGWSIGVILHFLTLYSNLSSSELLKYQQGSVPKVTGLSKLHKRISRNLMTIYPVDSNTEDILGSNTTQPSLSGGQSYGWVAAPVLLVVAAVIVVFCVIWGRWLFVAGETRYWRRVHNEHLQAASRGGAGGGGEEEISSPQGVRESSEETDEHNDSDRKELFTWDV